MVTWFNVISARQYMSAVIGLAVVTLKPQDNLYQACVFLKMNAPAAEPMKIEKWNKLMSDDQKCPECGNPSSGLLYYILAASDGCKTCGLVLEKHNEFKDKIAERSQNK